MKLLKSRKFQMAAVGVITVIIANFIPGINEAETTKIVAVIVAYIFGQGLADFGKEKAQRE